MVLTSVLLLSTWANNWGKYTVWGISFLSFRFKIRGIIFTKAETLTWFVIWLLMKYSTISSNTKFPHQIFNQWILYYVFFYQSSSSCLSALYLSKPGRRLGSQLNLTRLKDCASITTYFCSEKEMTKHRGKPWDFSPFISYGSLYISNRGNGV